MAGETSAELTVRLFGPPRMSIGDEAIRPHNRRAFVLLARVAAAEQPIARQTLAALCWEDASADTATKTLRSVLSNLRSLVPDVLSIERDTVARGPAAGAIDLVRFLELARTGAGGASISPQEQAESCVAALELVDGDLLAGCDRLVGDGLSAWLDEERRFVDQRAAELGTNLVQLLRRTGRAQDALEHARQLVARDPYRELSHLALVDTLLELDRRDEAIAQLERCRAAITDDLGVPVSPAVDERERAARDAGAPVSAVERLHPLPDRRPVVARDQLIAEVLHQVEDGRAAVLSLVGGAGVGKTTIAIEAAHRLREAGRSVVFVDLTTIDRSDGLSAAIGRALGTGQEYGIDTVVTAIGDRPTIVVLDNVEHLGAAAGLVITELVRRCGALTVLLTSRTPTAIVDEQILPVGPLPVTAEAGARAPAVELFLRSVRRQGVELDGRRSAADVVRLCELVGGLPLAIELAASRCRSLGLSGLVERLEADDLSVLRAEAGVPDRHRDLVTAVQHSIDLLEPDAVSVFAWATVFLSPFTLESLDAVCRPDLTSGQTWRALASLIDLHLLERDDVDGTTWIRFAPAIRPIAAGLLDDGVRAGLVHRRVDHDVHLLERMREAMASSQSRQWFSMLDRYGPTVLDTITWLRDAGDPRVVGVATLGEYWFDRGQFGEGARWLARCIPADATGHLAEGGRMWALALRVSAVGHVAAADAVDGIRQVMDRIRDCAPDQYVVRSLVLAVHVLDMAGRPDLARPLIDEGLGIAERIADPWCATEMRYCKAMLALPEGMSEDEVAVLRRVLADAVLYDNPRIAVYANVLAALGGVTGPPGGTPESLEALRQQAIEIGDRRQIIWLNLALAALGVLSMDLPTAARWGGEALVLAQSGSYHLGVGFSVIVGASVACFRGEMAQAARLHGSIEAELDFLARGLPPAHYEPYLLIAGAIVDAAEADPAVEAARVEGARTPQPQVLAELSRYLGEVAAEQRPDHGADEALHAAGDRLG